MKKKKNVPAKWYYEMIAHKEFVINETTRLPDFQQKRIDKVIASGLDYEPNKLGNIPLTKLQEFLESAKAQYNKLPELKQDLKDFREKYNPVKELKGNLIAAKLEAKIKKLQNPKFFDGNYYFFHKLLDKYYLSESEGNALMDYFIKLEIN